VKEPEKYVKHQLVDPVSQKPFKPTAAAPRSEGNFGLMLFENAANKATFDQDSAKYSKIVFN
jgi:YHS domain-containing protein